MSASASGPPDSRSKAAIRLSIAHLMLWTLGTAIALGLYRPLLEFRPVTWSTDKYLYFERVTMLAIIPVAGISIAGLLLAISQCFTARRSFPKQPGHWLLVTFGMHYLLAVSVRRLLMPLTTNLPENLAVWYWALIGVGILLVVVQVLPLVFLRDAPRWTVIFAIELGRRVVMTALTCINALILAVSNDRAVMREILSLLALLGTANGLLLAAATLSAVIVMGRDIYLRPRRDYLHWTGCVVHLLVVAYYVAHSVMPWILLR